MAELTHALPPRIRKSKITQNKNLDPIPINITAGPIVKSEYNLMPVRIKKAKINTQTPEEMEENHICGMDNHICPIIDYICSTCGNNGTEDHVCDQTVTCDESDYICGDCGKYSTADHSCDHSVTCNHSIVTDSSYISAKDEFECNPDNNEKMT